MIGVLLRTWVPVLRWIFIPASVIGGLVGLALVQIFQAWDGFEPIATTFATTWKGWPGVLISVVFAGLLLEHPGKSVAESAKRTTLAAIMVWVIVLGQVALGLLATWVIILPAFDVPASFGQLIEAGFAGGHGTGAALGTVFVETLDFEAGMDLALAMATIGLIYSVVSGLVFVNLGIRRGWTRTDRATLEALNRAERVADAKPMAYARIGSEVIDPFALQIVFVAIAFLIGMGLQAAFVEIAALGLSDDAMKFVGNVPLFLFTLFGGWTTRRTLNIVGLGHLIDGASIKRIVGISMEFLIVAAIASLRIEVIAAYAFPLSVLCIVAFAWTAVALLVLSRQMLPADCWFELGLLNYGMSTGTTAQGLMLLRIVDKDLESGAAETYALAAPFSAPFIGGGVITFALPALLLKIHVGMVSLVLLAIVVGLALVGRSMNRRSEPTSVE